MKMEIRKHKLLWYDLKDKKYIPTVSAVNTMEQLEFLLNREGSAKGKFVEFQKPDKVPTELKERVVKHNQQFQYA